MMAEPTHAPESRVDRFSNGAFLAATAVMRSVRAICPSPFISSAALRQRKKTDPQHGLCSCKSWPRRHEADGGQEELDGRWVSLPSGSSRRRRNLQLQSMRSTIRPGPFFSSAALRRKKNSSATPPL